jgi:SAM-dependent methyltransferase
MRSRLAPARRRGVEILDDPRTPNDVRERASADIARSNALFGGTRSVLGALRPVLSQLPRHAVLLDVGTGLGDIPARAERVARRAGVKLETFGVDFAEALARRARACVSGAAVASALTLPFADSSADIVVCSQLLHHFEERQATALIGELNRVARGWVIVSDLRRSWLAAAGFWLASVVFGFHRVTRHDGVTSVLRGFTADELRSLISTTVGTKPQVNHSLFWRLNAAWKKAL